METKLVMRGRYKGSRSRLFPADGMRRRDWLAIIGAAVTWACSDVIVGGSEVVGSPALAQAAPSLPPPPDDAPILSPGQRVQRPFGWAEIRSYNRSQKDGDTAFDIDFLLINESAQRLSNLQLQDLVRLIADGVPRAPFSRQPSSYFDIEGESAEYCNAKFSVRGQPHVVYIQFGTGDAGRSFLRWPQ
jgi:hypothetical protein